MTPFEVGRTASLVGSPLSRYGSGGTSYPFAHDPTHAKAYARVAHGVDDWADVRGSDSQSVTFRAWRVSAMSFAWQSSTMPAPAFMPYEPHFLLVTDALGTFCPGCREPLKGITR